MTDLLSRPATDSSSRTPAVRPLTVSAALAAVGAVGTTMAACMAVSLIGWFLADAGAHGETTDALRVGADAWLAGLGSGLTLGGVPLGIVPLALTGMIAVAVFRCGRWAGRSTAPVEEDRAVLLAATVFTGLFVVVAVVTCIVAERDTASPGLGRAVLGSLLISGVAGTLGLGSGTGRLRAWLDMVPGWIRSIAHGALAAFLSLVAVSAVLLVAALVAGFNEASTVISELDLGAGDYLMLALATLAVAPNAVLFASAYLLGPGFAIGTGTIVSPSLVALGPVPAFPLLAALPDSGPTPGWAVGVLAVPVLAGALGAVLAQRAYRVTAYDSAALRGFASGFAAAVATTLAIALAGGPMGTGRLADIGAPVGDVLVAAVMAMSLGGLVAGVATAWWQRRR